MKRMRTVLIISPCFAPQATVAAFRWVKLSRHLARHGFRCVVLCGTFPDDTRDPDLLGVLPPECIVVDDYLDPRVIALQRKIAQLRPVAAVSSVGPRPIEGLRPFHSSKDRYAVHRFHAQAVAVDLARKYEASAIVVSAGPFGAVPVAFHAGRTMRVPVILDFRDPFGLHESASLPSHDFFAAIRRRIVFSNERRWMSKAAHVVLNTRNALDAYRERYPTIELKSSFIRNHYDMALYEPVPANPEPPTRLTILHTGTLRADTRLDDIGEALRRLVERYKLGPKDIVFRQVGRMTDYERAQIASMGIGDFVETVPPVPQAAMLRELRKAHVLLSMFDACVRLRIAAKTYDYIAAGMPIVSITENAEVDELLAHRSDNVRLRPGDVDGLVATLSKHLEWFNQTRAWPTPVASPREFSSEVAAERFANIIDRVMSLP